MINLRGFSLPSILFVATLVIAFLADRADAVDTTKRLLNCQLNATKLDDCSTNGYTDRIIAIVIPGVAVAAVMIVVWPFFWCFRCCGCCGAGKVTRPISSCDVFRPKVYTFIVLAAVCGAGAWGDITTELFTKSVLSLFDDIQNTGNVLVGELNKIENSIIVTRYNDTSDKDYQQNLFEGTDLNATGQKLKKDLDGNLKSLDDLRPYIKDFGFYAFLVFTIPMGFMGFGMLFALCNCKTCLPGIISWFFFLFCFIFYVLFAVFNVLGLVFGDVCAEIHGVALGQKSILPAIAGCDDSLFASFLDDFEKIEIDVSTAACKEIVKLCYNNSDNVITNANNGKIYNCGSGITCVNVRFGDMVRLLDTIYTDPSIQSFPPAVSQGLTCQDQTVNCTIKKCSENCLSGGTRSVTGKASKVLYSSFLAAETVSNSIDTLGGVYGSCESLMGIVLRPFDKNCGKAVDGMLNMRDAMGFEGTLSFACIIVMILGTTRFMNCTDAALTRQEGYFDEKKEGDAPAEDGANEPIKG